VPTFCEICFWKCGVLAHVKGGRVTKITGNPDHPLSRGRLCPRGTGGTGLLYDPDRLKKPLVRRKKRGEEVFEEVSWDAALNRVAEGMQAIKKKFGPEAMALFTHGYGGSWFKHLIKAYGSPNIGAPSYAQCRGPREVAFSITYGQGIGSPEAIDIENARCLTLLGSHLGENMHNTQVQELADSLDRGMGLVVVDPRYSVAASKAKFWLPIKPGTDIALLLAWMNVIIGERLYDAEYVARYTHGFDKLQQHVNDRTPEWAYPLTGLRPDLIRDSARFIAASRPASLVHPGRRATWYGDDTQLPSNLTLPKYEYTPYDKSSESPRDRQEPSLYPLADETLASGLCDATIPGEAKNELKGWLVYGTNLMQALPDPRQTRKAIQALDLMVAVDVLPAEICGWADVVLPECTYLERCDDVWTPAYKQPFAAVRQPVVEPMYDSKPGWWMARELGRRLGLNDYFPWKDSFEYAKHRVKKGGFDCEAMQRTGVVLGEKVPVCEEEGLQLSFDTESKKIELHSAQLANLGFHPLPEFVPPEEPSPGMFRMLSGRAPMHTFGRTTNNRFLSQVFSENEVWINADAARAIPGFEERPLRSGDRVVLVNQDGVRSRPVLARVTQRIRGDCVFMVHGYGHTAKGLRFARGRGASDSELTTRYKTDPIMGGTGMNVNFVRIEREAQA